MNSIRKEAKKLRKKIEKEGWTIDVHKEIMALIIKISEF